MMSQMDTWKAFLVPKLRHILEYLTTQGFAMAARLIAGFLCVRLLAISEYAKFAIVYGFLGSLGVLLDVSFSGTLVPLIGERVDDKQLIADYVASLRQFAHWIYMVVAPGAIVLYPILVRRQQWSWPVVAWMVLMLLVVAWCDRVSGAYGAVLIVRRDRSTWYRVQMISSSGVLALIAILWMVHALTAFSAILANIAGSVYVSLSYTFRARYILGVQGHSSREKRLAIAHLALPAIPGVIFFALQGQISLFLITLFGHTAAVASVGALSRLSQIYVLFGQMGSFLLFPYFAKLPEARVKRTYLAVLAVQGAFCLFAVGVARYIPQAFLWILGHKYSGLRFEVFVMIAGSSVSYLCGTIGLIHWARKFVFWWTSIVNITVTLALQGLFIWKADLSSVRAVLVLNLATASVSLLVNGLAGIYGFAYGPRQKVDLTPTVTQNDYA
jgi:O-antigen/teichoic acid export membrane protein